MIYRQIADTDIQVSEVSLGCWALGGRNWENGHSIGWADVNVDEIQRAIEKAVDGGINHFDNADIYGNGDAERMLSSLLSKLGLKSEDFVIASKVGHFKGTASHAYEPHHIRKQCEQSLINLKRDYLDIYYLHHGDFGSNNIRLGPAAETMQSLLQEGKIRAIGQSAYRSSQFETIVPILKPKVLQSWAHLMDTRFIEPSSIVGQLLRKSELSFVAFSPLNQGLLLDKFDPKHPPTFGDGDHRRNNPKFSAESLLKLAPKLEALKNRFGSTNADLASVALRYVLDFPKVACVIPGFRNETQVTNNLSTCHRVLSSSDSDFIREIFGIQAKSNLA